MAPRVGTFVPLTATPAATVRSSVALTQDAATSVEWSGVCTRAGGARCTRGAANLGLETSHSNGAAPVRTTRNHVDRRQTVGPLVREGGTGWRVQPGQKRIGDSADGTGSDRDPSKTSTNSAQKAVEAPTIARRGVSSGPLRSSPCCPAARPSTTARVRAPACGRQAAGRPMLNFQRLPSSLANLWPTELPQQEGRTRYLGGAANKGGLVAPPRSKQEHRSPLGRSQKYPKVPARILLGVIFLKGLEQTSLKGRGTLPFVREFSGWFMNHGGGVHRLSAPSPATMETAVDPQLPA